MVGKLWPVVLILLGLTVTLSEGSGLENIRDELVSRFLRRINHWKYADSDAQFDSRNEADSVNQVVQRKQPPKPPKPRPEQSGYPRTVRPSDFDHDTFNWGSNFCTKCLLEDFKTLASECYPEESTGKRSGKAKRESYDCWWCSSCYK